MRPSNHNVQLECEFYKISIYETQEHGESAPTCRNTLNGACEYGLYKCWFIHNDTESENGHGYVSVQYSFI